MHLLLNPGGLPGWLKGQFQFLALPLEETPADRNFVSGDQAGLSDEIMKVGHVVALQPIKLGSIEHVAFGATNIAQ